MGDRQKMGAGQSLCGITRLQEGGDREPQGSAGLRCRGRGLGWASPVPGGQFYPSHAPFSLPDPWTHSAASSAPHPFLTSAFPPTTAREVKRQNK